MATLASIVREAMAGYAGDGETGYSYLTESSDQNVFTVVYITDYKGHTDVDTGLLVRLVNDRVLILRDQNDKPLVDALMQAGVPREQIVLAYAGEQAEEVA